MLAMWRTTECGVGRYSEQRAASPEWHAANFEGLILALSNGNLVAGTDEEVDLDSLRG